MSILDTLVNDRTEADVKARNSKGTYNASDLNRVGAAMQYIAARLNDVGYDVRINPKTDWFSANWPTPQNMEQYLANLSELRRQFEQAKYTPSVPADMVGLTWQEANAIEQMLMDIDFLLTNINKSWFYPGEIYSGEVSV